MLNKRNSLLIAALWGCAGSAPAAAEPAADADPTAMMCQSCHQGALSLAGHSPGEVTDMIQAIIAGAPMHPPIKMQDTDSAAVDALAQALTTPQ